MRIWLGLAAAAATLALCGSAAAQLPSRLGDVYPEGCVASVATPGCTTASGMAGTLAVAVSPDGRNVYVASFNSNAVTTFDRGPLGALSNPRCIRLTVGAGCDGPATGLNQPTALAVSADGANVYAATEDGGLVSFARGPGGTLSFLDSDAPAQLGQSYGVAVSPDGAHVYAGSYSNNAILAFNRAPGGALAYAECWDDADDGDTTCGAGSERAGLTAAQGVAVTPGGSRVYVAGAGAASAVSFGRSAGDPLSIGTCVSDPTVATCAGPGPVDFVEPRAVAVAPGGGAVYYSAFQGNSVTGFQIVPGSDFFSPFCWADDSPLLCSNETPALGGATGVAPSPDGRSLYVAGFLSDAITTFDVVPGTGAPANPRCIEHAAARCERQAPGLDQVNHVAVSPDGLNVYAVGTSNRLLTFARQLPPSCSGGDVAVPHGTPVAVPLACADPNGRPLTRTVVDGPLNGALGAIDDGSGQVVYTPSTGFRGADRIVFKASDGGMESTAATMTLSVAAPAGAGGTPPPPGGTTPGVAQRVRGLSIRPRRLRRGRRATIAFRLTNSARVRIGFERCRRANRRGRCVRWRRLSGSLSARGKAGWNRVRFSGRLRKRPLSPGLHRLTVRAGKARARQTFTVVR